MNNKQFKKKLISGAVAIALATTLIGNTNVEAKKKNHKPTLSFKGKLKKKKKMTVNVGDKVYVKGKAKDKEDGNITKKIKVKVTKPKNGSYKKKGNYITFKKPGKYKVKLNVKDSDKKSTSLSRTITVKSASLKNAIPTEQEVLPENNTTVTPTEAPVTTPTTLDSYGKIIQKTVNGVTYNVFEEKPAEEIYEDFEHVDDDDNIKFSLENDFSDIAIPNDSEYGKNGNYDYLKYYGKIQVTDKYGNDVTDNMVIYGIFKENYVDCEIYFFVIDSLGDKYFYKSYLTYFSDVNLNLDEYELIDEEKNIYADRRIKNNIKTLELRG